MIRQFHALMIFPTVTFFTYFVTVTEKVKTFSNLFNVTLIMNYFYWHWKLLALGKNKS